MQGTLPDLLCREIADTPLVNEATTAVGQRGANAVCIFFSQQNAVAMMPHVLLTVLLVGIGECK